MARFSFAPYSTVDVDPRSAFATHTDMGSGELFTERTTVLLGDANANLSYFVLELL